MIMATTTYLSPYVFHIIVECSQKQTDVSNKYVTPQLTYDWHQIGESFGEIADDFNILDQPEAWYVAKAHFLWEVLHSAGSAVKAASDSEKEALYQLCHWVCCHNDMSEYCRWSEEDSTAGIVLAILHMTAALERALGNIYLLHNHPVPFLLRDLLKSSELLVVFGKLPIVFTQLILGSPKGFNLRNVVWHGFVSPGELHHHLVVGLIVLFASLGKLLPTNKVIPKRSQFSSFEQFQNDLQGVFPDLANEDKVLSLLESSPYLSDGYQKYWKRAFELFKNKRYGDSMVLLLPQLEHCLRVIYCRVNDCPTRLLTAESTVLYTTLDEILAPSECPVVGEGLLMLLQDLMSILSGPRLRDRLSHGEFDLSVFPHWLANHVFCVAFAVAQHQVCDIKSTCCSENICYSLRTTSSKYLSRFHVTALIQQRTNTLLIQWLGWQHCLRPPDLTVEPTCSPQITHLNNMLFSDSDELMEKVQKVKACLELKQPPLLYRPKAELELASSLLSVVDSVAQTANKVSATAATRYQQWCERTLRSRARATAQRMWSVLPDIWTALLCMIMITALCYQNLPNLPHHSKEVHRLLKSLMKVVENTVVLCDGDRNRWTEAHLLLSTLAGSTSQWLSGNQSILECHHIICD